ncbi:O-methyltransferase [Geosmithia morbida]|uniref:O-methyltransferase n=1 Tax=Geosmithia morbida TaxID=1094350 RepID=A0A9P4YZJ7_9HYPO|nr:O-methyltransferase [Geosmithia morbida]KAF4125427.1 O-methyltransferase [Geosmithia morbida]
MDKVSIEKALVKARELVSSLESFDGTTAQHYELLGRVDGVRDSLEQPYDKGIHWFEGTTVSAALNILVRIGAYKHIPTDGSSITAADLAAKCGVDTSVTSRVLHVTVNKGIFEETGPGEYKHNELSLAYGPDFLGGFLDVCNELTKAWICLPDYFKTHTPEDLYDPKKTPVAFANGREGKTYYEVIGEDPERRRLWNLTMENMQKNFPIIGMFPFKDLEPLVKAESERPILIDVAGGRGQALKAIRNHCGDVFDGRLILQDLPIVIDSLNPEDLPGVQLMAQDIFIPQAVKNSDAHVYFLRRILHDYYDPAVVEILKNTASAMGPDSRLVICDMLLPDRTKVGGNMTLWWLDLSLLGIGGKERSMSDFERVLDASGLELIKLYKDGSSDVVMLETRLKRDGGAK